MRKTILIFIPVLLFLAISENLYSQTVYNFNSGLETAKSSNKLILVNIYKDSNSWYKKMEDEVYSSDKIKNILNNFVYVKLNAEGSDTYTYGDQKYSADGLAKFLGTTGFPTHVLMTPDGKIISYTYSNETITSFPGFIDEENFAEFLNFFLEGKSKDGDLLLIFQN